MSERELLEYALNTVHEKSVVLFLTHHYNHEIVTAFTGDLLFLVDYSIPAQVRIDAVVKRVPKMTSSAKVAIAPPGAKGKEGGGGGEEGGKRKKWSGKQQQQQLLLMLSFPPGFGGGFAPGAKTGGTIGGGSGAICYLCGMPCHIAIVCHKKGT
jgi:hypothetical protein